MIYTKRRRTLLAKAVITYSGYLFVGLVVGQLVLLPEHILSNWLLLLGLCGVSVFLALAFLIEPKED